MEECGLCKMGSEVVGRAEFWSERYDFLSYLILSREVYLFEILVYNPFNFEYFRLSNSCKNMSLYCIVCVYNYMYD